MSAAQERTPAPPSEPPGRRLAFVSLAALGVVYGDIGTSPLYAIRECFHGEYGIVPSGDNVLGVLSLMFWSLMLIVSTKYLTFILRADNQGEGGVIALTALVRQAPLARRSRAVLVALGLFAASLLYGDGMITPAISVLSAVEGLRVITPLFETWILPATVAILLALFVLQRRGTGGVGALFGPIMLVWLATLAALGLHGVVGEPRVLWAIDPRHGLAFLLGNHLAGFLVLGAVFLVVTGAEALYADLGHFGRRPIRLTCGLVLPALLLNYFGQRALLLAHPEEAHHPFGGGLPDRRPGLLLRQHQQGPPRRLVPAGHRRGRLHPAQDLGEGPCPARRAALDRSHRRGAAGRSREEPAAPGGAQGRVHDRQPGEPAAGAAPQPQAQPGAAREGRAAHGDDRRGAAGAQGGEGRARGPGQRLPSHHRPLRLHGEPQHPARPGPGPGARPRLPAARDQLLPRPRAHPLGAAPQAAPLAAPHLRLHDAQRLRRHLVLQHPPQPVVEMGTQVEL